MCVRVRVRVRCACARVRMQQIIKIMLSVGPYIRALWLFGHTVSKPSDDDDDDNFIYMYIPRHTCNGMRFAPELLHSMPTIQSFHTYSTSIKLR